MWNGNWQDKKIFCREKWVKGLFSADTTFILQKMLGAPATPALPQSDRPNSSCQRARKASKHRDWKKLTMPDLIQQGGHSVFKRGCCGNGTGLFGHVRSSAHIPSGKANKAASYLHRNPKTPRITAFSYSAWPGLADFQSVSLLDTLPFRNEKAPVVEINTSPLHSRRLGSSSWRCFPPPFALLLTCKFFSKHRLF